MEIKHKFLNYLAAKKKAQKTIDEHMQILDMFGDTPPIPSKIGEFAWNEYGTGRAMAKYRFLEDYAGFCDEQADKTDTANAIRAHICEHFEGAARRAMASFKKSIVPIPEDTIIDIQYLNGLSNNEYVEAFAQWQGMMGTIYHAIEQGSPFEWGWPDWRGLTCNYDVNHHRVMVVLEALAHRAYLDDTVLLVNKKDFYGYGYDDILKPKEKANLMLKGLANYGLYIEGLNDKKAETFTVSCPDTPHVMRVIHSYFASPSYQKTVIFSYRFVEKPQMREAGFLARTDALPKAYRDMHYWVYDDAVKHGVWVTPYHHEFNNSIVYAKKQKSSQRLLMRIDKNTIDASIRQLYRKHPGKMPELEARFPGIFNRKRNLCRPCKGECDWRLHYGVNGENCCGYSDFCFKDVTFEDVKFIFELFKLENNIKPNKGNPT